MGRNIIETVMGAVVLIIAAGFLFTAYKGRSIDAVKNGTLIKAEFDDVSGIAVGSDVRMGGVKIGVVDSMDLNTKNYRADVALLLRPDVPLPKDSSAAIVADGLLGSKFVTLEAGAEDRMLKDGESIRFTQSSVSLEQLIGKFIFSGAEGTEEEPAEPEAPESSGSPGAKPADDADDFGL